MPVSALARRQNHSLAVHREFLAHLDLNVTPIILKNIKTHSLVIFVVLVLHKQLPNTADSSAGQSLGVYPALLG